MCIRDRRERGKRLADGHFAGRALRAYHRGPAAIPTVRAYVHAYVIVLPRSLCGTIRQCMRALRCGHLGPAMKPTASAWFLSAFVLSPACLDYPTG
eukprot:3067544-Rhodomonas_salina.3